MKERLFFSDLCEWNYFSTPRTYPSDGGRFRIWALKSQLQLTTTTPQSSE